MSHLYKLDVNFAIENGHKTWEKEQSDSESFKALAEDHTPFDKELSQVVVAACYPVELTLIGDLSLVKVEQIQYFALLVRLVFRDGELKADQVFIIVTNSIKVR